MPDRSGTALPMAVIVAILAATTWTGCTGRAPRPASEAAAEPSTTSTPQARSEQYPKDGVMPVPLPPKSGMTATVVPSVVRAPAAIYIYAEKSRGLTNIKVTDPPGPARPTPKGMGYRTSGPIGGTLQRETPEPLTPGLSSSFESINFDTNPVVNQGRLFIPPDPIAAAGINHVVAVTNTVVEFRQKDGTLDFQTSLASFFSTLAPLTFTFDPRVIYDQYADRWIITTAEQTDTFNGQANDTSRLFVAVSDDGNPNGSWTLAQINLVQHISGRDTWADFPMLAVDDKAIYITSNQFGFFTLGPTYNGVRLWIIDKGLGTGGIYDGGFASVNVFDPYPGSQNFATSAPAHVFGTPQGQAGTIIVSYEGLSDGTNEFVQTVRIDDPLGSPVFTQQFVNVGNIDPLSNFIPDAPQSGSTALIATNNRRALSAVWRDNTLWATTTLTPLPPGPDAGQTTAHWFKLDTTTPNNIVLLDQGDIGGEDISAQTYTFFPSIAVNATGEVALGFAASSATIFAGAYYATLNTDGTTGNSRILREGTDFYVRTFGGNSNRWGDYSGVAVDPVDQCFWVYNQYAMTRGTPTGSGEDGRWATAMGKFCPTNCGDGILESPGEECDDGNSIDDDACSNLCVINFCGDGTTNNGEQCDDGNLIDNDSCRNDCTTPFCGDLILDQGETCEPPGAPAGAQGLDCRVDCTVCGDGVRNSGEQCDDGNAVDDDDCSNACTINVCTPGEIVLELNGNGPTMIDWVSSGDPFFYDMISGLLSQLQTDGGIFQAICFSNNLQTPMASDSRALPPGFAYYYLVRPQAPCGSGDYGVDSDSGPRGVPWPNDCQ